MSALGKGLLAVVLLCTHAVAQGGGMWVDLAEASLESVLEFFGELTGKTFVLAPGAEASLNAIAGAPAPDDPMGLLHLLLRASGLVAEDHGAFVVVRPRSEQAWMPGPVLAGDAGAGRAYETVTRIVPLGRASGEFLGAAQSLVEPDGVLGVVGPAAVAVGSAASTERLARLAGGLERALPPTRVEVVPLRHASAKVAAEALSAAVRRETAGGRGSGGVAKARVVAYPDGGAVVLVGEAAEVERLSSLCRSLDVPFAAGAENISVMYLDYADAQEVAETVWDVARRRAWAGIRTGTRVGEEGFQGAEGRPESRREFFFRRFVRWITGEGVGLRVASDPRTNALVLLGEPWLVAEARSLALALDRPPRMVELELTVVEASAEVARSLAAVIEHIEVLELQGGGTVVKARYTDFGLREALAQGTLPGLTWAVSREPARFGAILNAAASRGQIDAASALRLVVAENEEARIFVGTQTPYVALAVLDSEGRVTDQSVEYAEVGMEMTFLPRPAEDGSVALTLSFAARHGGPPDAVTGERTFSSRTGEATVRVPGEGREFLLAGLEEEMGSVARRGVPVLSDLPIVGPALAARSEAEEPATVLVLARVRILQNCVDTGPGMWEN